MKNKTTLVLVLSLLLLLPSSGTTADKKKLQEEGAALLARAAELSNIRCSGCLPFRLQAKWRAAGHDRNVLEGTYLLIWVSPNEWREEIAFPGFSQLRVGGEDKMWQVRNLPYLPLPAYQVGRTLDLTSRLKLNPDTTIRKLRSRKRDGHEMKCVELKRKETRPWPVCLDPMNDTVNSIGSSSDAYEYSDYKDLGEKRFPGTLRSVEIGTEIVHISVQELSAAPTLDPSLFLPPPGAKAFAWCENPEPAKELEWGKSDVAISFAQRGTFALAIYAAIATDGSVQRVTLLQSARRDIDANQLERVKKARFRPKMCNGTPVEDEKIFQTTFHF